MKKKDYLSDFFSEMVVSARRAGMEYIINCWSIAIFPHNHLLSLQTMKNKNKSSVSALLTSDVTTMVQKSIEAWSRWTTAAGVPTWEYTKQCPRVVTSYYFAYIKPNLCGIKLMSAKFPQQLLLLWGHDSLPIWGLCSGMQWLFHLKKKIT